MEFLKKVNALMLGLAVLLAYGCGGEEPEPVGIKKDCTVIKRTITGTETYKDEATINAQGQIIEVLRKVSYGSVKDQIVSLSFLSYNSSGQLIKKDITKDGSLLAFYTYQYNSLDQLIKTKSYTVFNNDSIPQSTESFEYDSSNRLKKRYIDSTLTNYHEYSYPSANKIIYKDYVLDPTTNQTRVRRMDEMEFDSKRAPKTYHLLNHTSTLPGRDFENNVISVKTFNYDFNNSETIITTYQYNSDDYPISWTSTSNNSSNVITGTYDYNCQ